MNTELIKYESVYKIVNDYMQAVDRIKSAYTLLFEAQMLLESVIKYAHVLPRSGLSDYDFKQVLNQVKSDAWKGILDKTNARKFMTNKRYEEFLKSLEKPEDIPDLTIETVMGFVQNLVESAPDMLLEFIKETFNWLHPGIWSTNKYKTNEKNKYEIKEKIIKESMFNSRWSGSMDLSYYQEQNLRAMDSAFHLMDGKGIPKEGSAYFAINEAVQKNESMDAETNYFVFRWYKNGNCHIKFKRMDLVGKMNQIAGENILKGM
uniref:DUF4942 domain-containing protein n=1 Tax=viral metagenome TaxID=1070528 RepID=A0A6M3JRB8_9ZZZZ